MKNHFDRKYHKQQSSQHILLITVPFSEGIFDDIVEKIGLQSAIHLMSYDILFSLYLSPCQIKLMKFLLNNPANQLSHKDTVKQLSYIQSYESGGGKFRKINRNQAVGLLNHLRNKEMLIKILLGRMTHSFM